MTLVKDDGAIVVLAKPVDDLHQPRTGPCVEVSRASSASSPLQACAKLCVTNRRRLTEVVSDHRHTSAVSLCATRMCLRCSPNWILSAAPSSLPCRCADFSACRAAVSFAFSSLLSGLLEMSRSYVENRTPQSMSAHVRVPLSAGLGPQVWRSPPTEQRKTLGVFAAEAKRMHDVHNEYNPYVIQLDGQGETRPICNAPGALPKSPHLTLLRMARRLCIRTGSYFRAPMSRKSRRASSERSLDALNHTAYAHHGH